jgi:outer membrane protein
MKKLTFLFACLLLASAAFGQKFGYCNSSELLTQIPEVKAADSDLQAFQTQLTKRGQEMVKALQDKAGELERKRQQGLISPKDLDAQTAKLQEEQAAIEKYEREVYEKLSQKREMLFKPILDRVNQAMTEVAKEEGFLLVFDTNSRVVLYADDSLNVTPSVKKKLGLTK